jgi:nucleoside-diphosphate-sugar epimerase
VTGSTTGDRETDDPQTNEREAGSGKREAHPLVLVTGGTGFIGRHLVHALLRTGQRVRVLARQRPHLSLFPFPISPSSPGAEIVWGDVTDPAAVERAVRGADTVFHLAACARPWTRDPREFTAVNVKGTRLVCDAARAREVRKLVHVSTELVQDRVVDHTAYQRTKRAAEALVAAYVAQGADAVIVRPTRVYGPGPLNPANSVTRVMDLYRRGLFRMRVADGGARANYVYVEDVVDGLLRAAERGERGAAYLLGGENLTLVELLALVGEACGAQHATLPLPLPAVRFIAAVAELGGLVGLTPPITRDWVDLLSEDRPMSSELAKAELHYQPRGARAGVAATVAWLSRRAA